MYSLKLNPQIRQNFQVICPEIRKATPLPGFVPINPSGLVSVGAHNWQKIVRRNDRRWAWDRLAKAPTTTSKDQGLYVNAQIPVARSSLERLPPELLHRVLSDTDLSKIDVLAVGISSEALWPVVLDYIDSRHLINIGSWAGRQIICLGSFAEGAPPSLRHLQPNNSKISRKKGSTLNVPNRSETLPDDEPLQALFEMEIEPDFLHGPNFHKQWQKGTAPDFEEASWHRAIQTAFCRYGQAFSDQERAAIEKDVKLRTTRKPSNQDLNQEWVLRNLSKRLYVKLSPKARITATREPGVFLGHEDALCSCHITVEDVLYYYISWYSKNYGDSDTTETCYEPDQHGEWAGDAFDIVPVIDSVSGFNDVTESVASRLARLVECGQGGQMLPKDDPKMRDYMH